jgi:hypothetical protein
MSIWTKSIDQITFEDVERFCTTTPKPREGPRLDFKSNTPSKFENILSAFANTLGGIVILGVAGDKRNEPVWPPAGVPDRPGISEQITQIGRDAIYPPLFPEISSNLPNPHAPGTGVVVIRVHESPDAPHAVDGGRAIYERTEDVGTRIKPSHIDRIKHLLDRRERVVEQRRALIDAAIQRAKRHCPTDFAMRWASSIPLYPHGPLCTTEQCFRAHQQGSLHSSFFQRAPWGSFARSSLYGVEGRTELLGCSSIDSIGHVFAAERCSDEYIYRQRAKAEGRTQNARMLSLGKTIGFFSRTHSFGVQFLRETVGFTGYILLTQGLIDCQSVYMTPGDFMRDEGRAFPDPTYEDSELVLPSQTLTIPELRPLAQRLEFAFDLSPGNVDDMMRFR